MLEPAVSWLTVKAGGPEAPDSLPLSPVLAAQSFL